MTERVEVPNPVTRPFDIEARRRTDENGNVYTTLSDRNDIEGLIWDSEMLNWTLFNMADRLGLVPDTENGDLRSVDLVPEDLAQQFFKEYDRLADLLCTCDEPDKTQEN